MVVFVKVITKMMFLLFLLKLIHNIIYIYANIVSVRCRNNILIYLLHKKVKKVKLDVKVDRSFLLQIMTQSIH